MEAYILLIFIYLISTFTVFWLMLQAINQHTTPIKRSFVGVLVSVLGWAITVTLTRLSLSPENAIFWSKATYIFVSSASITWFVLSIKFAWQYRYFNPKIIIGLCIIPVLTIVFVYFNDQLHFIWKELEFLSIGPFIYFDATYGFWFWVHSGYNYTLFTIGTLIIFRHAIKNRRLFSKQAFYLVFGAVFPLFLNIIFIFRLIPFVNFDITPIGFSVGALALSLGINRYHLLKIIPIAYETFLYSMHDGVLIVNNENIILSHNPAARDIFIKNNKNLVGQDFRDILSSVTMPLIMNEETNLPRQIIKVSKAQDVNFYEIQELELTKENEDLGKILVFHNITKDMEYQTALKHHRDHLQNMVDEQTQDLQAMNAQLKGEIEARKKAEVDLQNEKDVLAAIMETSPIGIIQSNAEHDLVYINEYAAQIFQSNPQECVEQGLNLRQVKLFDLNGEPISRENHPLINDRDIKDFKYTLCMPNGEKLYLESSFVALWSEDKKFAGMVGTITDISERIQAEEQLKYYATHDTLTKIPNRHFFTQKLDIAFSNEETADDCIAIIFIDLDNFKAINDAFDHNNGDVVLMDIAKRLRDNLRSTDIVSRHGGDEFVILVRNCQSKQALVNLVKKLQDVISKPIMFNDIEIMITASFGIAVYPSENVSKENIVQCADIAMYHAKKDGKNSYKFYVPSLMGDSATRLGLLNDLRSALSKNEFKLLYQPIVNIKDQQSIAFEALIRWQHPFYGVIAPIDFLPLAEENNLMVNIGQWVIRQALEDMSSILKDNAHATVHINISEKEMNPHLPKLLSDLITETGCKAEQIVCEIIEKNLSKNLAELIPVLKALKELGVGIALDDFGSGQTAINQLALGYIDILKIDQSMTKDIYVNKNKQKIVSSLIDIANDLNINVVAEGVENEQQLCLLSDYGCKYIQGWYFSKALTVAECASFRPVMPGESGYHTGPVHQ